MNILNFSSTVLKGFINQAQVAGYVLILGKQSVKGDRRSNKFTEVAITAKELITPPEIYAITRGADYQVNDRDPLYYENTKYSHGTAVVRKGTEKGAFVINENGWYDINADATFTEVKDNIVSLALLVNGNLDEDSIREFRGVSGQVDCQYSNKIYLEKGTQISLVNNTGYRIQLRYLLSNRAAISLNIKKVIL